MSEAESDATELADVTMLRAQHRVGRVLRGKWHLDALLGVGGMAAVYAATHRNGKRAAIKVLHPELSVHGHVRSRFLKEGYVANRVDHPGAVQVLDDDTDDDGSLYLVMELLDGESLERRQARLGRLAPDEVLAATDQLLDVLAAAHEKGIVHRDIKPENVFLTRDGVIKVLDFGIARLRELSTASSATRTGATMGTPAFMPPEQARGLWDEVDGRSDLWAVGATMFSLVTGRMVHEARTTNEQLLAAMTEPAAPLSTAAPDVPEPVAAVVDHALAYRKEDRFPDARAMQDAVRRAYHALQGAPISSHRGLTVPPEVTDRTLVSAELPAGATTGRAVVSGRTGMPLLSIAGLPGRKLAIGGALAAAALVVVAVVVALIAHHGPTVASAGPSASAAPAKPSASAAGVAVTPAPTPKAPVRPSAPTSPTAAPVAVQPARPRPAPKSKAATPAATPRPAPHQPAPITTQQNW